MLEVVRGKDEISMVVWHLCSHVIKSFNLKFAFVLGYGHCERLSTVLSQNILKWICPHDSLSNVMFCSTIFNLHGIVNVTDILRFMLSTTLGN